MRRKFTRNSIWSDEEEEYARSLREEQREKVVVTPDAMLAPGERYKSATLRMPRVVADFDLVRIEKSAEGISLVFKAGKAVFEYADMTDFVRELNLLHFAFGGGLLDIVIGEDK
jgi:hypothetical protein